MNNTKIDKNKISDRIHEYINNKLNDEFTRNYSNFKVINKYNFEEGVFMIIENIKSLEKSRKVIGVLPINSDSIYSCSECFEFKEFTTNDIIMMVNNGKICM